jgi:hypothetical protein
MYQGEKHQGGRYDLVPLQWCWEYFLGTAKPSIPPLRIREKWIA